MAPSSQSGPGKKNAAMSKQSRNSTPAPASLPPTEFYDRGMRHLADERKKRPDDDYMRVDGEQEGKKHKHKRKKGSESQGLGDGGGEWLRPGALSSVIVAGTGLFSESFWRAPELNLPAQTNKSVAAN